MKKIILLAAAIMLLTFNASALVELPYASGSFSANPVNGLNDDGWSYAEYGPADTPWVYATNFQYSGMNPLRLGANTYNQSSDAWLVSPKFKAKKGNEYTITFYTKSQAALNLSSTFNAYLTDMNPAVSQDNADATLETTAVEFGGTFTTTYTKREATFTATKTADCYIAMNFIGTHNSPIFIADVNITEVDNGGGDEEDPTPQPAAPAAVSNLAAAQDADGAMNVSLSWTNPTLDVNGNAVTLSNILIYRDSAPEALTTLPGTATEYTDENVEAGDHTYSVVAVANSLESERATVSITVTAPAQEDGAAVPVTFTINSQDDFNRFTVITGPASDAIRHWVYNSSYGTQMTSGSNQTEDDWLISPAISVESSGLYLVTLNTRIETLDPTYPYHMEVMLGTSNQNTSSFTLQAADITEGLTNSLTDYTYPVQIDAPGTYYIGVHTRLQNRTGYAQHYYVKAMGLEKSVVLPGVATDVKAEKDADDPFTAIVSWTNPTDTDTEGTLLSAGDIVKAVVYRDGEAIVTVEDAGQLVPGQTGRHSDTVDESGDYTYKVEIYTENGKSKTTPAEVTLWLGTGLCLSPDGTEADFSEWTLINSQQYGGFYYYKEGGKFEFYRYSSATNVDDWAISPRLEFESDKVYKVEIETYEYDYGSGSEGDYQLDVHLGSATDPTQLPRLGDTSLVNMTKGTTADQPNIDVFYINTPVAADEPQDAVAALDDEEAPKAASFNVAPGTLRLALRARVIPRADADFYINSLRITELDVPTGIGAIASQTGLVIDGDNILFEGPASVRVYNLSGAIVAADANARGSFSIAGLASGVYVVSVTPADGNTVTVKIIN